MSHGTVPQHTRDGAWGVVSGARDCLACSGIEEQPDGVSSPTLPYALDAEAAGTMHPGSARCLSSLWEGASPAQTHASARPARAYGDHLRPATNGASWWEACGSTTTRLQGPATGYECCSAHGLTPCRNPSAEIPTVSRSPEEVTSYERLPASPARARTRDPHPAPLSPLPFDPHRGGPGWAVLSRMFCNDAHEAVRF